MPLYIVATPIGNLEDISQRALKVLGECDAILCEDTRRTAILLRHYGLKKELVPYHKFNEAKSLENILNRIASEEQIALCSDAGTPCINDPGGRLIAACAHRNLPFTAIPGPCSLINALVLSAFETKTFQFIGYLPKNAKAVLKSALFYPGVSIAFESPERLNASLRMIDALDPKRSLAVAREMTKMFEECRRGIAAELLQHFTKKLPKGEIVLVIGPQGAPEISMDMEECVQLLQEMHGLSLKEAIKQAARFLKLPKSVVYKKIYSLKTDFQA
ncbi:MAG TPA: 16S rRNA (cytidine(1402)-2'-O)-methyltransferase [Chlamydiales bacterium]|nr:16S rRNA (cytidine(1402)-2'-O)-methyltransferase [Chlamydiales bacterium]